MKFVIIARPFGYAMYASGHGVGWSDRRDEAIVYDDRDNQQIKLKYWKAMLTISGIESGSAAVEIA